MFKFKHVALGVAATVAVALGAYHVVTTERATLVKQTAIVVQPIGSVALSVYAAYSSLTHAEQHDDHVQRYHEHRQGL